MTSLTADGLFTKAVALENTGHLRRARSVWERFLGIAPTSGTGWLRYGSVLRQLGQFEDAIMAFGEGLKTLARPSYRAIAQAAIGRCEDERGEGSRAEKAYRAALRIEETPETWLFLANLLTRMGRDDEAGPCLRAALKLEPDFEEAQYNLGCWYRLRRRYRLAEGHFRRAVAKDPDYALAHAELGWCLSRRPRKLREAHLHLVRAIQLDPTHGPSRLYLAVTLWRMKQLPEALDQYQAALRNSPKDALSHACYGDFLCSTGLDQREGIGSLRRARRLDPNLEVAARYLRKHLD